MKRNWSNKAELCDEFVQSIYEEYSADTVAELLMPTGLLIDKSTQYVGSFERYIFLQGNKDEVYTKQEIDFISEAEDIVVFAEFYKKSKNGQIPCRVVAVRTMQTDAVSFSIAFTKIINKASEGFNICIVISNDGIIFACRAYDDHKKNACYISDFYRTELQLAELYDSLMYAPKYDGFIEYYTYIREAIRYKAENDNYLSEIEDVRSPSYEYFEALQKTQIASGFDLTQEIERRLCITEDGHKEIFADRLFEADDYLFKIESSRINTVEMLFDAEELEKLASKIEQQNETMHTENAVQYEDNKRSIDNKTKALLEDPEAIIKLLKKKRGI